MTELQSVSVELQFVILVLFFISCGMVLYYLIQILAKLFSDDET